MTGQNSSFLPHAGRVAGALIWNDLRQGLRKHLKGNNWRAWILRTGGITFGLGFLAALHWAAYALLMFVIETRANQNALLLGVSTAIWSFLLFVMISGGLMRALVVLHEQDDSSLLLASPVSPRAILAARLFGNALQSCVVDGFIIVPWINVCAFVFGRVEFLWGYPVWFAIAIIVTCIDGLFSFGLIRWLGLRRARIFSQAVPFLLIFGVTFFAGSLSLSVAEMDLAENHAQMPPAMQVQFFQIMRTPLAVMARAAAGGAPDLLMIFAGAVALAFITLRLTEKAFIEGTQNIADNVGRAATSRADAPFRSNLLVLEIHKNLRMIVRTPMMMVQCIAQVLTPIGIAFVLGRDDLARAVAFFVIFAVGVLAGMFTIAAGTVEECDDLLGMSPRPRLFFRVGKILSGCFWPITFAVLAGLGLLIAGHPLEAAAVHFGGIPLGLAASIVGETFATPVRPGVRPKLLADPIMMIPLLGMQITSGLIAGTTVFAAAFSSFWLLLSLVASYFLLLVAVGLAQLRKPLL